MTLYRIDELMSGRPDNGHWRPSPTALDRQGRNTHFSRSDAEAAVSELVEAERGGVEDYRIVEIDGPPEPRRETRTEADMAERYDTRKLRLPRGYGRRLDALCETEGQSASKLVATWIDGAERAERELAKAGGKGTK